MNRRKFLKIGGASLAAGAVVSASLAGANRSKLWKTLKPNPTATPIPLPTPEPTRASQEVFDFLAMLRSPKALEPEGALEICIKGDALADAIEPFQPPAPRTVEQAQLIVWEVSPYAVYERILPAETNYGGNEPGSRIMLPTREVILTVSLIHYGGEASFHLLGTAPCYDQSEPFHINIRYFNPASPLYDRKSSQITTLIHEAMHMQGICTDSSKGDEYNLNVESATQLATFEVLAAMTIHGNKYGLVPFIREIQGYAADFLYLWAVENDKIDFYRENVVHTTANDRFRVANFEKTFAHWMETYELQFRLKDILQQYGVKPYKYIVEAMNHPELETRTLPFPNRQGKIRLNDAAYVLEHLYELVQDYPKLLERGKQYVVPKKP